MKTEEDFKKVTQLVNGDKYEFVRILEDSEIDKFTNKKDENYYFYRVLGKSTDLDSGEVSDICHDINGVFSATTLGGLNMVFSDDL